MPARTYRATQAGPEGERPNQYGTNGGTQMKAYWESE